MYKTNLRHFVLVLIILTQCFASRKDNWETRNDTFRVSNMTITSIRYRKDTRPVFRNNQRTRIEKTIRSNIKTERFATETFTDQMNQDGVMANLIDSPPVDGFIPWVSVGITDARYSSEDLIFEANVPSSVQGTYLSSSPEEDYAIGILDTGASAHALNYMDAGLAGVSASYLTSNLIEISGVSGSVFAWVSEPLGLFIDGLGAIDPVTLLANDSNMVGQWNTSVAVGDVVESTLLPTVIGTPLTVYYVTHLENDRPLRISRNGSDYNSPNISLFLHDDPCAPSYSMYVPLELRPLGGINVQYIPTIDPLDPLNFEPQSPSTIIGQSAQSLLFVHSVDLYEAGNDAIDKDRFMFDTGAQVTVIGSRIASELKLNPDFPEFEVEITGVTGDVVTAPGFHIDRLEIPAIGEWLLYENAPVVVLDIASPEGGTLDGIIGMNLFTEYNLIIRGGGLLGQDDPRLEFEPIFRIVADIAPEGGDGRVDYLDLRVFSQAWLATSNPLSSNWNFKADMAPAQPDGVIDFLDFAVFAYYWLEDDSFEMRDFAAAWLSTSNPPSTNWNYKADVAPTVQPDGIVNFFDYAVYVQRWIEEGS